MTYVRRTLTTTIQKVAHVFPVLLLTGPRQVGKTTLLKECSEKDRRYVTLDDLGSVNISFKALF